MSSTSRTLQNQVCTHLSLQDRRGPNLKLYEIRDLYVVQLALARRAGLYLSRKGDELKSSPPLPPFSIKSGQLGTGRTARGAEERTLHHVAPIPLRPSESERRGGIKVWARSRNPSLPPRVRASFSPEGLSLQKSRSGRRRRGRGTDGWIWSSGFGQMSAKPEWRW